MQLYSDNKLYLTSVTYGIRVAVNSYNIADVVSALRRKISESVIVEMLADDAFIFEEKRILSPEISRILDCYPEKVQREHKIATIKLIRFLTDCNLKDAVDAYNTHLESR